MKKTVILSFMITLIMILCVGCKNQEKTLTICVDSNYIERAYRLVEAWQQFNKDIKVDVIAIPQKTDETQIKITEIRTAMMSGEGPDVFILSTDHPNSIEGHPVLFENVEKAMQSEIFLPLDDYMEQAQYMHVDAFNPVVFNAGKTDEGQLVLPIYYGYFVGAILDNDETSLENMPDSWDALVNHKDFAFENNGIPPLAERFFDVLGKYVDYKSHMLLYTEDEILARVQEVILYEQNRYPLEWDNDAIMRGGLYSVLHDLMLKKNEKYKFYAIPSVDGGITANISMYAAISRSTPWPDEAFSIIDMLFSDAVMMGEGFEVGEKIYGNLIFMPMALDSILIHEAASRSTFDLSNENLEALNDLNSKITNVRFYSDLDKDLLEMYDECSYARDASEQREIVSQIYNRMKMKLAE